MLPNKIKEKMLIEMDNYFRLANLERANKKNRREQISLLANKLNRAGTLSQKI